MLLRAGVPNEDERERYAVEVKWDGMRAQLRVAADGSWCLRSRPGRDCTEEFPEIRAHGISCDLFLDGELVCLGADGKPDFAALRRRLVTRGQTRIAATPTTFVAFDVLHHRGRAVRTLPFSERRDLLRETVSESAVLRRSDPLVGDFVDVLEVTRAHHLEGVVCKHLDRPYEPGRRSGAWLKHKHRRSETVSVTGWSPRQPHSDRGDVLYVARLDADGNARPVGGIELRGSSIDAVAFREALDAHARARGRRGIVDVAAGITLDVESHGPPGGPLRDPIVRAFRVGEC